MMTKKAIVDYVVPDDNDLYGRLKRQKNHKISKNNDGNGASQCHAKNTTMAMAATKTTTTMMTVQIMTETIARHF